MSSVRARWDPPHMPTNPRETINALIAAWHAHKAPVAARDGRSPAQVYIDAIYTTAALPLEERAVILNRLIAEVAEARDAVEADQARRRGLA